MQIRLSQNVKERLFVCELGQSQLPKSKVLWIGGAGIAALNTSFPGF